MNLDMSRLRRCDRVIGAGALALLVILFLFKWYGVSSNASVGGVSFSSSANGWHTFTNSRWIWIITIIVGLAFACTTAARNDPRLPVQPSAIVAGLGALSTVLILYRIINHPTAGANVTILHVHYTASAGIKIGIWLALIAAAAITYGGYLAMQEEGTTLSDVREQAVDAFSGLAASAPPRASDAPGSPDPSDRASSPPPAPAQAPPTPTADPPPGAQSEPDGGATPSPT
jgi:hypothetical protein